MAFALIRWHQILLSTKRINEFHTNEFQSKQNVWIYENSWILMIDWQELRLLIESMLTFRFTLYLLSLILALFYLSHSMWYLWLFFYRCTDVNRQIPVYFRLISTFLPERIKHEYNFVLCRKPKQSQLQPHKHSLGGASLLCIYVNGQLLKKKKTKKKSVRSRPSEHNRIASLYLYTHKKKWFRSAAEFDENSIKQIEKSGYYDVATTDEEASVPLRPKCEKRSKRGSFWRTKLILNLQWFFLNSFVFSLFISKTTKIIAFEWEYYEGFPLQSRRKLKKEKKYFYPLKALHSS